MEQYIPVAVIVRHFSRAIRLFIKLDADEFLASALRVRLDHREDVRRHPRAAAFHDEVDAIGHGRIAEQGNAIPVFRAAEVAEVRLGKALGGVHTFSLSAWLLSQESIFKLFPFRLS